MGTCPLVTDTLWLNLRVFYTKICALGVPINMFNFVHDFNMSK